MGRLVALQFFENLVSRLRLHFGVGIAGVDEVEKNISLDGFLEGAVERGDQLVGNFPDEADGVDEEDRLLVGEDVFSGGRIEGGEEFIFDEDVGVGEGAEKGRFADVGVADDRKGGDAGPLAKATLGLALLFDGVEFIFEAGRCGSGSSAGRVRSASPLPL